MIIPGQHQAKKAYQNSDNPCHLCEKRFVTSRDLKKHVDIVHGQKGEFKCDSCDKVYGNLVYLQVHVKRKHVMVEDKKDYKCGSCDKVFSHISKSSIIPSILVKACSEIN